MPGTGIHSENVLWSAVIVEESTVRAGGAGEDAEANVTTKEGQNAYATTESKEADNTLIVWGPKTFGAREYAQACATAVRMAQKDGITMTKYMDLKVQHANEDPGNGGYAIGHFWHGWWW